MLAKVTMAIRTLITLSVAAATFDGGASRPTSTTILSRIPLSGPLRARWDQCTPRILSLRFGTYCSNPPALTEDEGFLGNTDDRAQFISLTALVRHGDRSAIHVLPGSARPDWPCGAPLRDDATWAGAVLSPLHSSHDCLHGRKCDGERTRDTSGDSEPGLPPLVAQALQLWRRVRSEGELCSKHTGGELSSVGWAQLHAIGTALGNVPVYRHLLMSDNPRTAALAVGSTDTGRTMLSATALVKGFLDAVTEHSSSTGGNDAGVDRLLQAKLWLKAAAATLEQDAPSDSNDNDDSLHANDDVQRQLIHGGGGSGRRNLHAYANGAHSRYAASIPQLGPLPLPLHVLDRRHDPAMFGSSPSAAQCPGLQALWDEQKPASYAHAHIDPDVTGRLQAAGMRDAEESGGSDGHRRNLAASSPASGAVPSTANVSNIGDLRVALSQAAAPPPLRVASDGIIVAEGGDHMTAPRVTAAAAAVSDGATTARYLGDVSGPVHEVAIEKLTSENAADDILTRLCHSRPLPCFGVKGWNMSLSEALSHYGCSSSSSDDPTGGDFVSLTEGSGVSDDCVCMTMGDAASLIETAQAHYRARYSGSASQALMYPMLSSLAHRWRAALAAAEEAPQVTNDDEPSQPSQPRTPRVLLRAVHDTVIAPLSAALGLHDRDHDQTTVQDSAGRQDSTFSDTKQYDDYFGGVGYSHEQQLLIRAARRRAGGSPFLRSDVPEWWPRYASRLVFELWRIPGIDLEVTGVATSGDSAPNSDAFVRVLRDGKDVTPWTRCATPLRLNAGGGQGSGVDSEPPMLVLCPLSTFEVMTQRLLALQVTDDSDAADGAAADDAWGRICSGG